MCKRPDLNITLDVNTFRSYYYLKEELVQFCRENHLPVSGSKLELIERIACFLDSGTVVKAPKQKSVSIVIGSISGETPIEPNIVCSEKHRAFFVGKIGKSFSFNVVFQKWLKANAGKTYDDAVNAYYQTLESRKTGQTKIDKQFEYNAYIRDFFINNKGKTLDDAIKCWKYKKNLKGKKCYSASDLVALDISTDMH